MPTEYIKKLSKEKNISIDKLEKNWAKAKEIADESGHSGEYDYITGIFKKMIGERLTFLEYSVILYEDGEPSTSVSGGGIDNPDGKILGKMNRRKKRKKKKDDEQD